ncbi:MAG: multicopper oxidase domain-containing protein [Myxococcales bacterium]|nr:multicopper oxidase domain-containing protein [Myxococcales bacterium]
MKTMIRNRWLPILLFAFVALTAGQSSAAVQGIQGSMFNLNAEPGYITTGDGESLLFWGYNDLDGAIGVQYPGPTLLLMEGDTVTINLTNDLPENVSLVFPGQDNVTVSGGVPGLLTSEATPGGSVSYTFTATHAGTYTYYSGTHADLQVEMGLVGAIVVYPGSMDRAYDHAATAFDREFLFLLTEMASGIHYDVEFDGPTGVDTTGYFPDLWFINGRAAPDTMSDPYVGWLPAQPYNCMPMMHPGETLLLRFVGAGRNAHPFHHHANNATAIAIDGRLLESTPGAGPDLGVSDFTQTIYPGETEDALFTWSGAGLGWDIYGHDAGDPLEPGEDPQDHGKPFPVLLPEQQETAFGEDWSGSPFLGQFGPLPPGQGIGNLNGGYFFMWHSHAEKEMVNNDIFPGGMMTMLIIEHPDVPIMEMQ